MSIFIYRVNQSVVKFLYAVAVLLRSHASAVLSLHESRRSLLYLLETAVLITEYLVYLLVPLLQLELGQIQRSIVPLHARECTEIIDHLYAVVLYFHERDDVFAHVVAVPATDIPSQPLYVCERISRFIELLLKGSCDFLRIRSLVSNNRCYLSQTTLGYLFTRPNVRSRCQFVV